MDALVGALETGALWLKGLVATWVGASSNSTLRLIWQQFVDGTLKLTCPFHVRGRLRRYTLDRLIEGLVAIGQEVEVRIPRDRVSKERAHMRVT